MPLSAGDRLGPYEILSPLGEGGMGEVWKARDTRLDRIVALKVAKADFTERFEREARAVAALSHPNICTLHDVGPNYLVMEFIEGTPLKGPLPLQKAVEYAGQILDALDAAHRKGITHRDLKPGNILVPKQGIKLLDFGLAKQAFSLKDSDATLTEALTTKGQIVGTLQYMSPEQLQGKEADARSDLFSFGCVLYEMLTGKRAFEGESAASVIAAILEREPAPLDVAPPLERVIKTCLAKDPEERIQTARDVKKALAWALEPRPVVVPRHRWWIAVAAIALGAVGGGLAVSRLHQPTAEPPALRVQINPPEGGRFAFGNNGGGMALSPDGRTVAYVASVNGRIGIWVRPLDGATARLLPGTEGAGLPFWSPDNKSIAFVTKGVKLQRIDLAGGAPLAICDVGMARGGAWTSDGRILFGSVGSSLFQVQASGGKPALLTTLDASRGENAHRLPQMLPGGRFLFWVRTNNPENTGVYASSLAKPRERLKVLTSETNALYTPGGDGKDYLLWLRGGTLMAQEFDIASLKLTGEPHPIADPVARIGLLGGMNVTVSATGLLLYSASNTMSQFTWLDREGKSLGLVGEPGEYGTFQISPDGRRVATTRDRPGGIDLWLLEAERGVSSRFTFNSTSNSYPVWSPDGRTVLYTSIPLNLFRKNSGGGGVEERLTESPIPQYATDWSRDGRFVLYFEIAPGTQRNIWVLPVNPDGRLAAGAQPRPYLVTPFNEWLGRFSTEASPRWVAYQSDESGRNEVYLQSFPEPRGKWQISTGGGANPQWGVGGRELFYVSPENKLMQVGLKLDVDSVSASAPRELFPLRINLIETWSPYDVDPSGQRFLVAVTPDQAAPPLTMIVNWPALLKRPAGER